MLEEQRVTVWTEIALKAQDQLRQRVAWALSQIMVVSPDLIKGSEQTEMHLTFYDIFVRHAFGNYFDILKEVTYSPIMSEMLSFLDGRSTHYNYIRDGSLLFADENFAREIMQLFSIGLVKLNIDGSVQLDNSTGSPLLAYTNEDITEYARAYTGFRRQFLRGNIEEDGSPTSRVDRVDPMKIYDEYRDHLPKVRFFWSCCLTPYLHPFLTKACV